MTDQPTRSATPDQSAGETRPFGGAEALATPPASSSDRYELHTPIAAGGMGEVFAARDLTLNREVAVKVLRDDLRDRPAIVARFLEEARITGQLQHPNIPPVHDLGTLSDGRPFIAMKLIKGRTLADLLTHSRPDPHQLVAVFEQICQAVAFAHERSVIHRDLKPSNVMVGKFSEVQVMDWGLAKVVGEPGSEPPPDNTARTVIPVSVIQTDRAGSSFTMAGSLLGTPAYMPPEQAKGDVDRTDTRSDVFALGALLCELLTGKPPYSAPSGAEVQAMAIIAQTAPAFERLEKCGADAELVALAKHCLATNQDDRPADAGVVANRVAAYRTGVSERLRAAELARARAEEKRKRARVQLALFAAVGLLLAAGGAFAWWQDHQESARKAERERDEAAAKAERDREEVRTREAVTAALDEAEAALRADDIPAADTALARARTRLGEAALDDLRGRLASLTRDRQMVETLEFLVDGQRTGRRLAVADPTAEYSRTYPEAFRAYGIDIDAGDPAETAARVTRAPICGQLLAGLYRAFARVTSSFSGVMPARLPELLRSLDGHPVRSRVRDAVAAKDRDRIRSLVRDLTPADLTPEFALLVGDNSALPLDERLRVLRAGWALAPANFDLNNALAYTLCGSEFDNRSPEQLEAGLLHARLLVGLRPASPFAQETLAYVLRVAGHLDEAVAAYLRVYDLNPTSDYSLVMLADLIQERAGKDEAIKKLREVVARFPDRATAHIALGNRLARTGEDDAALASYRHAIKLDPGYYRGYTAVGSVLERKGDLEGAVAAYREGMAKASSQIRFTANGLSRVLHKQGKYREAFQCLESTLISQTLTRALTTLNAARALAAAGTAGGVDPFPASEWPAVRRRALGYLREYLAVNAGWWQNDDTMQPYYSTNLWFLLNDERLARVRHPVLLALLPTDEAEEWRRFWAEVRRLHDKYDVSHVAPMPRRKW